jgi:hypothetical protein
MTAEPESRRGIIAVCRRIADSLEHNAGIAAVLLLLLIFVLAVGQSASKLLWYDELITVRSASLPHWSDVWSFYSSGLDSNSPLASFIVRVGLMLPFGPEIASRLPFTFAFLVMCLCVFGFVRRRYPAGYALAALILSFSPLLFYFATEARAYAVVLAGAGVALYSWQSAVDGRSRPVSLFCLWLALALAVDAHAFAIFLFIPFATAQFLHDFRRKKPDWAIWAALLLFPIGIMPVLHGELLSKRIYGANFWSQPDLKSMFEPYADLLFSGGLTYLVFLLLVAVAAVLLRRKGWRPIPLPTSAIESPGFSVPEWTLVAMLALLPLYVVPLTYPLHAYHSRYVLYCNIGLIVLVVAAAAEAARRSRIAGVVLLACFLFAAGRYRTAIFIDGLRTVVHPGRVHPQLQAGFNRLPWVTILQQITLPVVTDDPLIYSQLDYYARPELEQRLIAVTDLSELKKYPQTTTPHLNLFCFGKGLSFRVADVADVLPANPHFLLVENADMGDLVWLPRYLADRQASGNAKSACLGPDCSANAINVYDVHFISAPNHVK